MALLRYSVLCVFLLVVCVLNVSAEEGVQDSKQVDPEKIYQLFTRRESILLDPGDVRLEASLQYATDDEASLLFNSSQRQLILIPTLSIGILNNTELALSVPGGYRQQRAAVPQDATISSISNDNFGIGDLSIEFRRLLHKQEAGWPELTWSLGVRFPTGDKDVGLGTDDWVVLLSLNAIKSLRPAFIIASLGVGSGFNEVDPFIQWRLGVGVAVTYNLTIGADVLNIFSTNAPEGLLGERAQLRLRGTYAFTQKLFGEFGIGIGLTDESPSAIYTLTVGWRF